MAGVRDCDGCGYEHPNTHLCYSYKEDGYYCDQCINDVEEDD